MHQHSSFRRASFALVLASGLLQSAGAHAQLVARDGFNYPAGSLNGQKGNGDFGWSSGGSNDADHWFGANNVVSPGLQYASNGYVLTTSGNSAETVGNNTGSYRLLNNTYGSDAAAQPGGTLFVSFLARIDPSNTTALGSGSSYAGVSLFQASGGEKFFMGLPGNATNYGFDPQQGGSHVTQGPVAASSARTDLLVYRFDLGSTITANLFVDPVLGPSGPGAPVATLGGISKFQFNQIRIQSGGSSSGPNIDFDELRIGGDYASVAPAVQTPEPGALALAGAGLAGLLAVKRRRRATR